ncbi:MAG: DUF1816 domain-containing protein [Spirulina sp.]
MRLSDLSLSLLERLGLAYWIELRTDAPQCLYYFGPFPHAGEAEKNLPGYLEDLELEGASNIKYAIAQCKPKNLTVFEEDAPTGTSTAPKFA